MDAKLIQFNLSQRNKEMPNLRAGDWVKVYRKVQEEKKERIQIFEGMIIAIKGKQSTSPMITVRKVSNGIGVEIIVPIYSPMIEKIELVKRAKVRRAKLYYIRQKTAKSLRFKFTDMTSNEDKENEKEKEVNKLDKKEEQNVEKTEKENKQNQEKSQKKTQKEELSAKEIKKENKDETSTNNKSKGKVATK